MKSLKNIFIWCRRYISITLLLIIAFILYLLFFNDENSIRKRIEYNDVIDSLRTEISINQDTFLYYQRLNNRLTTDPQLMEQVAREQYHMNRTNEDVYVFE